MALTIQPMTSKERLYKLVDELSEAEAEETLVVLSRSREQEDDTGRRQRAIDQAIIDSYTQIPQEDLGASWAAQQSIREEPWDRKDLQ
jgi:hypothetical protein